MKNLFILLLIALTMVISGVTSAKESTNDLVETETINLVENAVESGTLDVVNSVKSTGEEITETVQSLSSSFYDGAKSAISDLAKALEVPATHVYEVLIRQQFLKSMSYSVGFGLLLLVLIILTTLSIILSNRDAEWIPLSIVAAIVLLAAITGTIVHLELILTGFVNPEYGAMIEIVNWIK
jgi:hypothetical protein